MQEPIALSIVALCAGWMAYKLFLGLFKDPLAGVLLRLGKVSLAMRVRGLGEKKSPPKKRCCSTNKTPGKVAAG